MRQSMIILILTLILLGVFTSCGQYKTQISVEGGNPPTFRVSGTGTIVDFRIYGPKQRDGDLTNENESHNFLHFTNLVLQR